MKLVQFGWLLLLWANASSTSAAAPVIPGWYSLALNAHSISTVLSLCRDRFPQYAAANDIAYKDSIFSAVDHEKLFRFLVPNEQRRDVPQLVEESKKVAINGFMSSSPDKQEGVCRDLSQNIGKVTDELSGQLRLGN